MMMIGCFKSNFDGDHCTQQTNIIDTVFAIGIKPMAKSVVRSSFRYVIDDVQARSIVTTSLST